MERVKMIQRKGYGQGRGKGYYNMLPMDSHIHSLSAKGVKSIQPQINTLNAKGIVQFKLPKNLKFTEKQELFIYPNKTKIDVPIAMTYDYAKEHFPEELMNGELIQFSANINYNKQIYESEYSPEHKGIFIGKLDKNRESPNYDYV